MQFFRRLPHHIPPLHLYPSCITPSTAQPCLGSPRPPAAHVAPGRRWPRRGWCGRPAPVLMHVCRDVKTSLLSFPKSMQQNTPKCRHPKAGRLVTVGKGDDMFKSYLYTLRRLGLLPNRSQTPSQSVYAF